MQLLKVKNLNIVTLLDNSVNTLGPLAHWGLSMLITYKDPDDVARRILMDTGSDRDSLIRNAKFLKIDLKRIDAVVLSHGHLDHTAATVQVAEVNPGIRIHTHPSAFDERYYVNDKDERRRQSPPKGEGLTELKATGARVIFSRGPVVVSPGVWATGEVPRRSFETIMELNEGKVVREEKGVEIEDFIPDDQSIFMDLKGFGVVVVTGCAHSGILNTLAYVGELTGNKPKALIGGTHLTGRKPEYVAKTIEGLREYSLVVLSPSHCTGFKAATELYGAFPQAFELSYSGKIFDFDEILKKKSYII